MPGEQICVNGGCVPGVRGCVPGERTGEIVPGKADMSELHILSHAEMDEETFVTWYKRYVSLKQRVSNCLASGRTVGTGLEAVWRLTQRKVASYAITNIAAAQDFMKIICEYGDTTNGRAPAGTWKYVAMLTTAMRPWILLLGETTTHKRLQQVAAMALMQPNLQPWRNEVVYARVNMITGDMYIGETDQWARRVETHYRQTMQHTGGQGKQCCGCAEHAKYVKHRVVKPQQWMMVPLVTCNDKKEGRRMEEMLRRKWKPNMNAEPMSVWKRRMYGQGTYAADKVKRSGTRRTKQWKEKRGKSNRAPMTKFEVVQDQNVMYNLYNVLTKAVDGTKLRIAVTMGAREFTSWSSCRRDFEGTVVYTMGRWRSLAEWRNQMCSKDAREAEEVTIRVQRTARAMPTYMAEWEQRLQHCTETELRQMWRTRGENRSMRKQVTNALWKEYEQRYEGLTRRPIEVRVPYMVGIRVWDIRDAVRQAVYSIAAKWPYHIVGWHARNVRIITIRQRSVGDMLNNVQKVTRNIYDGECSCTCKQVCARMRSQGMHVPDMVRGHLCITGREVAGRLIKVMGGNSKNIPTPTAHDFQRSWSKEVWKSLPASVQAAMREEEWNAQGENLIRGIECASGISTRDVRNAKKIFEGMVIGPIDKNQGEMSMVCPVLYEQTLAKLYSTNGGVYEKVYPNKVTAYRKKKHGEDLLSNMTVNAQTRRQGKGTMDDIIKAWRWWYQKRGYQKIAKFDGSGGISKPYALYKDKNLKPEVRHEKLHKARPITPGCKHPMAKMLSAAGRAWSFLVKQLRGQHYVLHTTRAAPKEMDRMYSELRPKGEVKYKIMDIEGCFTNMPKPTIMKAMTWLMQKIFDEREGSKCIAVPRGRKQPCKWGAGTKKGDINIQPDMLMEWVKFDLENAYIQIMGGNIAKQTMGIPMGSPLSPAMAIATTAYMEQNWRTKMLKEIPEADGTYDARRYMDDVIFVYTGKEGERALEHFRTSAYEAPLKLEDAEQDVYLETKILGEDITWRRMKNKNEDNTEQIIWKYQRYDSYAPYGQKWAVMMSTLAKVHEYATDGMQLLYSASTKLREFEGLGYPNKVLRRACIQMMLKTNNPTWMTISQPFGQHQRHLYN